MSSRLLFSRNRRLGSKIPLYWANLDSRFLFIYDWTRGRSENYMEAEWAFKIYMQAISNDEYDESTYE